ncbi:unnamed protein product [Prunus armeniaca]|uniref:ABC transporter domain-containing protein n=1 Tax=Prunus armeniaca TaxID=36596 RepID=A0A6J5VVX8_PRUAR|nr:unnamed protein product [Prunus armeniaca]
MQVVITWPSPLLCLKLNKPCSFDIVQIHLWFSKASIHWGEKIGVVDRTGSGKSILIQVFFRLVEPSGGKIIIDGIDITTIGLHNIRNCGRNIDPVGMYSDEEIWKSLERCQLKDEVAAKPDKLNYLVADDGDNWSMGQTQLLCLGRVMLAAKHSHRSID